MSETKKGKGYWWAPCFVCRKIMEGKGYPPENCPGHNGPWDAYERPQDDIAVTDIDISISK